VSFTPYLSPQSALPNFTTERFDSYIRFQAYLYRLPGLRKRYGAGLRIDDSPLSGRIQPAQDLLHSHTRKSRFGSWKTVDAPSGENHIGEGR
jgi:hypothetical protein